MTVQQAVLARRSVRAFTDEPINDATIRLLLESAMAAPSACNKRPWEFYVVTNPDIRQALRGVSRYTNMNSALNIIVAGNEKRGLTHKPQDFWIQDCAAAVENILLTVTELGLGACWCGLYPMVTPVKRVRALIPMEECIIPMALLHIGHPADCPPPRTQYDEKRVHRVE